MGFSTMNMAGRAKALVAVVLSAGMLSLAAPVMAQEISPETLALARQYIDLTDRGAIYEVTLVQTGVDTMRQIVQQNPELADATSTAVGKILEEYRGRKGELLDQFARVYAIRFTPEEMQQIVDFYSSPTGSKLAQANAEVNQDLQRVLQVFTQKVQQEFFAKVRAELRSQGLSL